MKRYLLLFLIFCFFCEATTPHLSQIPSLFYKGLQETSPQHKELISFKFKILELKASLTKIQNFCKKNSPIDFCKAKITTLTQELLLLQKQLASFNKKNPCLQGKCEDEMKLKEKLNENLSRFLSFIQKIEVTNVSFSELNQHYRQVVIYYHLFLNATLQNPHHTYLSEVYNHFIKPLEETVLFYNNEKYFQEHLEELNVFWKIFYNRLHHASDTLSKKWKRSMSSLDQSWNRIVKENLK